jgi:hypothetical protein
MQRVLAHVDAATSGFGAEFTHPSPTRGRLDPRAFRASMMVFQRDDPAWAPLVECQESYP